MDYVNAFWVGGLICALVQILLEKTTLLPGRIMVLLVVAGSVLGAVGWYEPLIDFAGAGASVPLPGFGNTLWKGVKEAVDEGDVPARTGAEEIEVGRRGRHLRDGRRHIVAGEGGPEHRVRRQRRGRPDGGVRRVDGPLDKAQAVVAAEDGGGLAAERRERAADKRRRVDAERRVAELPLPRDRVLPPRLHPLDRKALVEGERDGRGRRVGRRGDAPLAGRRFVAVRGAAAGSGASQTIRPSKLSVSSSGGASGRRM